MKNYEIDTDAIAERGIIHGELIILPVKDMPDGAVKTFTGTGFVAGHSETGHHHIIEGVARAYELPVGGDDAEVFFRADTDTKIKHLKTFDRHEDMPVYGGQVYIVKSKNEFDYFANAIRKVRD